MGNSSHRSAAENPPPPQSIRIKTTLFELIDALGKAVEGEEEKCISHIILHLVNSGKIKLMGNNSRIIPG